MATNFFFYDGATPSDIENYAEPLGAITKGSDTGLISGASDLSNSFLAQSSIVAGEEVDLNTNATTSVANQFFTSSGSDISSYFQAKGYAPWGTRLVYSKTSHGTDAALGLTDIKRYIFVIQGGGGGGGGGASSGVGDGPGGNGTDGGYSQVSSTNGEWYRAGGGGKGYGGAEGGGGAVGGAGGSGLGQSRSSATFVRKNLQVFGGTDSYNYNGRPGGRGGQDGTGGDLPVAGSNFPTILSRAIAVTGKDSVSTSNTASGGAGGSPSGGYFWGGAGGGGGASASQTGGAGAARSTIALADGVNADPLSYAVVNSEFPVRGAGGGGGSGANGLAFPTYLAGTGGGGGAGGCWQGACVNGVPSSVVVGDNGSGGNGSPLGSRQGGNGREGAEGYVYIYY